MTPSFLKRSAVIGAAAAALSFTALAPANAAPLGAVASGVTSTSSLVEKAQVRARKPVRRVVRARRGNAAGAAVAAGVLGLAAGAIIAGSQSPAYADPYYAPGYYGAPGYYAAPQPQYYYAPSQYYADPYYGSGGTVYYNGQRYRAPRNTGGDVYYGGERYRAPRNSGDVIYGGERYRAPRQGGTVYYGGERYRAQPAQPRYSNQPRYAPQYRGPADAQGRGATEKFINDTRN
ncbi:MAG: hypothetical protein ACRCXM_15880 [Beijerinckiaceae bacterium]